MLIVVAPASTAARQTSMTKSGSDRVASWGENSTSSTYCLARSHRLDTACRTSPWVIRSICSMWIGEVEMKTWMRLRSARLERVGGLVDVVGMRAGEAGDHRSLISAAIRDTASKSPGRRRGESGFDDVDLEAGELAGDRDLVVGRQRDPRGLFAVAQRGVEDDQAVGHGESLVLEGAEWDRRRGVPDQAHGADPAT